MTCETIQKCLYCATDNIMLTSEKRGGWKYCRKYYLAKPTYNAINSNTMPQAMGWYDKGSVGYNFGAALKDSHKGTESFTGSETKMEGSNHITFTPVMHPYSCNQGKGWSGVKFGIKQEWIRKFDRLKAQLMIKRVHQNSNKCDVWIKEFPFKDILNQQEWKIGDNIWTSSEFESTHWFSFTVLIGGDHRSEYNVYKDILMVKPFVNECNKQKVQHPRKVCKKGGPNQTNNDPKQPTLTSMFKTTHNRTSSG